MGELPRVGVITIQGGGALGIELLGQLQGLVGPQERAGEPTGDAGVAPAAVAGSSAGAIIATLYWLGYEPEAILGKMRKLFEPSQIDRFFAGRWHVPGFGFRSFVRVTEALGHFFGNRRWRVVWPGRRLWWLTPVWPLWQASLIIFGSFFIASRLLLFRGLFPGRGFVNSIDALVRDSPLAKSGGMALPETGLVTFGDIARVADPELLQPLFLIATDITKADMRVICSFAEADRDVPIAQAVRASSGFPVFFTPAPIGASTDCYVDGGVVSNFPSWVFAGGYRRSLLASGNVSIANAAFLPWVHYGLRLEGPAPGQTGTAMQFFKRLGGMLTGAARTRLDDKLAATVVRRRDVVPSPAEPGTTPAGVLDFLALSNDELVQRAFDRGRADGQRAWHQADHALPSAGDLAPILKGLVEEANALLRDHLAPGGSARANIFVRDGESLIQQYDHGYTDMDPDRHMRLNFNQGITGLAFTTRQAVLANLRDHRLGTEVRQDRDPMLTGQGAPPVRADRSWLLSMPILDLSEIWPDWPDRAVDPLALEFKGPTFGVLNVDAPVLYNPDGPLTGDPARDQHAPVVRAVADVMKLAALRCSRYFGKSSQDDDDARDHQQRGPTNLVVRC